MSQPYLLRADLTAFTNWTSQIFQTNLKTFFTLIKTICLITSYEITSNHIKSNLITLQSKTKSLITSLHHHHYKITSNHIKSNLITLQNKTTSLITSLHLTWHKWHCITWYHIIKRNITQHLISKDINILYHITLHPITSYPRITPDIKSHHIPFNPFTSQHIVPFCYSSLLLSQQLAWCETSISTHTNTIQISNLITVQCSV